MAFFPSFNYGGNTGQSYDGMLAKRRMADVLGRSGPRQITNVGEGINSAASSIASALLGRSANKQQEAGQTDAISAMTQALGGYGMGSPGAMAGNTMTAPMGVSDGNAGGALGLIREFEGFRETPYWDVNALRSGYGSDTVTLPGGQVVPVSSGTKVSREDAERDLARRVNEEFTPRAMQQVGGAWDALPQNARDALVSVTYNYGSLPQSVVQAAQSGDINALAASVEALSSHNDGINAGRRAKEAAYIRGGAPMGGGQPMRGIDMSIVEALSNPYLPEEYRAMGNAILGQQMQSMQPMSPREQLELEMAQLELERMKNPTPTQQPLVNAGSGQIYDPNTQKWISAPQGQQAPNTQYVEGLGLINTDTGEVIRSYNTPKDAPQTVKTTREDGSEVVVQWDGDSGEWVPLQAPGGATSLAAPADLTESQARMTLFKSMQDETQPVLGQIEEVYNPANIRDAAARRTPLAGNFYQTPEGQRYQAAASAWAEGALRLATGAAATPEEFERTISTYFAQPGDTPETIQFKAQMREMYTRSVQRALGQNPEGKLSLPSPADFAKTVTPPSNDFSGMDMTGLLNFDIMTATPEQMDAWEARMKELQNGK